MINDEDRRVIKIIDNELFMRHLVFKNSPKTQKKKKEEMEFIRRRYLRYAGITEDDIKEYDERKEIQY